MDREKADIPKAGDQAMTSASTWHFVTMSALAECLEYTLYGSFTVSEREWVLPTEMKIKAKCTSAGLSQ